MSHDMQSTKHSFGGSDVEYSSELSVKYTWFKIFVFLFSCPYFAPEIASRQKKKHSPPYNLWTFLYFLAAKVSRYLHSFQGCN